MSTRVSGSEAALATMTHARLGVRPAWQLGGVLNVVALLLFVVLAAWSVATAGRRGDAAVSGRAA